MSWELLLKAKISLPQENKESWLEHLESEESMTRFMRRLRNGQYETKGIMRTISFLRDEGSDENLENYSSIEHDEEEIVRRFREHKPTMLRLLTNKVNRIKGEQSRTGREHGENVRIENEKQIFDLFDELVEANPSNVKLNSNWGRKLLALEETLIARPKLISRLRNKLISKYNDFFSEWPIPGVAAPSRANQESGAYQPEWWEGNDRKLKTLVNLFKGATKQIKGYTANTLDADLTHTYYSSIAKWNKLLIPDELLESDLFTVKKLHYMNPNLLFLLKENNPISRINIGAATQYAKDPSYVGEEGGTEQDIESHQEKLKEISGKGLVLNKEGYDELKIEEEDLLEQEEEAKLTDGNFSQKKQKDLKLLSEFFNSGTHKVFDYRDVDYVQIIIPSSLQRKITNLYKEAGYDEDYPLDEDLESHLKEPKQYEDTSDAIGGIDLDTLTGEPESTISLLNLLNTIKEADEALDLNSFSENTGEEFDKAIEDIRQEIIKITQEKVNDIAQNPTNYRKIKPIKSAEFIEQPKNPDDEEDKRTVTLQTKQGVSIFDALASKKIIEEVVK